MPTTTTSVGLNVIESQETDNLDSSDPTFPAMNKKVIKNACVEQGGFETAALNDTLYLHYKGYTKIENLDEYVGLKALWLDSNGLQEIGNLNHLCNLRCLFLQRNLLTRIQGLDGLVNLVQLDLSENMIQSIYSLSCLPKLSSLNISKNLLSSSKSITHLSECKTLANVEFSHNKLEGENVLDVLSLMRSLLSINMVGNPVVNNVSNFRKCCIGEMKLLRYLDRPIFDEERTTVEAWVNGGSEAELEMKKYLHEKKLEEGKKKTKVRVLLNQFYTLSINCLLKIVCNL